MVRGSPHKNTPPFLCGLVDLVDFEGDFVFGARNSGTQVLAHQAVLPGAEHDGPVVQHVIDRKHRGAERAGISDPADATSRDQPQALALIQLFKHRPSIAPGAGATRARETANAGKPGPRCGETHSGADIAAAAVPRARGTRAGTKVTAHSRRGAFDGGPGAAARQTSYPCRRSAALCGLVPGAPAIPPVPAGRGRQRSVV